MTYTRQATTRQSAAPVVVRRACLSDLPAVVEIERRAFSDPWSLPAFAAALARSDVHFIVAEPSRTGPGGAEPGGAEPGDVGPGGVEPAGVAGYLVAWHVGDEAEIGNVAVDDRWRGRGVGAMLLDDALAIAGRGGVRDMYLEVRESNDAARALYVSRGFVQVGRRRRYYRAPVEDALVLHRPLIPGEQDGQQPGRQ